MLSTLADVIDWHYCHDTMFEVTPLVNYPELLYSVHKYSTCATGALLRKLSTTTIFLGVQSGT